MVRQASTVNPIQLYTLLSPPPNRPFFHQLIPSKVSFTPSVGKCWLPYYIRNSRFHSLNQKTPTATCRLIQPQHGKSCKARVRSCQLNQQKVSTHQEKTSQHGESNWTVLTHQWYTSQHGKSNTAMHSAKPATPNRPFFHKFIPSEDSFTPSVGKCWLPYYSKKFPLPLTQPENTRSHLPTDSAAARQVLQS